MVADQIRTVMHGPPPLDLAAVVRVMEFLGEDGNDTQERLGILIKIKTIHQAMIYR
ncbi:hypothetical protein DFAR_2500034 [Desulfarculales bacterium]